MRGSPLRSTPPLNAEAFRGIEFDDPNHELIGWIFYRSRTPLLNSTFELPSDEVPFDFPARLETRNDGDGTHRVILFAADLELGNFELRLAGWDKDNQSIPGIAPKVQNLPAKPFYSSTKNWYVPRDLRTYADSF